MNRLAEVWIEYVTTMLWQSSLLMLVIGVLYLLSWKRSAAFRYALLCIILLKFLLPTNLESVNGLWSWFEVPKQPPVTSIQEVVELLPFTRTIEPVVVAEIKPLASVMPPILSEDVPVDTSLLLFISWLLGVLVLASALVFRASQIKRQFSSAQKVDDSTVLDLLNQCRQEMGITRPIPLFMLTELASPVLVGLIRPRILVTKTTLEGMNPEHLRPIFLHELAHVRRWDLIVNTLQIILQVLWFFHPGLWLTNWLIHREREVACDDAVLSLMEGSREVYAGSILTVLKDASASARMGVGLLGIAERSSVAGRRIRRILDKKTRATKCLSLAVIVLLIGLSAVLLPSARSQKEETATLSPEASGRTDPEVITSSVPSSTVQEKTHSESTQSARDNNPIVAEIRASYANQRVLFKNMKFKARWTTLPKRSFADHLDAFHEPGEIMAGIQPTGNVQGCLDQVFQIDTQGRYFLSHAIGSIMLVDGTHLSIPRQFSYDGTEYQGRSTLYSTQFPPAITHPRTVPAFFMDHLFNTDLQEALGNSSITSVTKEASGLWHLAFQSTASGKHYEAWSDPSRDYLIKKMISINRSGQVLTKEMDYKKTTEGFWYPSAATIFLDPNDPVSVEIQGFVLNGPEPSYTIAIQPGESVRDYRKSLDVPDVFFQGTKRKTYGEVVDGTVPYIAGVVTDVSGAPVSGAKAYIFSEKIIHLQDNRLISLYKGDFDKMLAWTDAQGRFAIPIEEKPDSDAAGRYKETGEYALCFLSDSHSDVTLSAIPISSYDVKVTLPPLGTVSGRVVQMSNGNKVPCAGVSVEMERLEVDLFSFVQTRKKETTITNSQGEFYFDRVRTYNLIGITRDDQPRERKLTCQGTVTYVAFWSGEYHKEVEIVLPDPTVVNIVEKTAKNGPRLVIRPYAQGENAKQAELVPYHTPDTSRGYVAPVMSDVILTEVDLINPDKEMGWAGYYWVKDDSVKRVEEFKEKPQALIIILDGEVIHRGFWNDLFKPASYVSGGFKMETPHSLAFSFFGGVEIIEPIEKISQLDIPAGK